MPPSAIPDTQVREFATLEPALRDSPSLTDLNLSRNRLGAKGGPAVAAAVRASSSLARLSLDGAALPIRLLKSDGHGLGSLGLKWAKVALAATASGHELHNADLASALQSGRIEFSRAELEKFGVRLKEAGGELEVSS